MWIVIPGKPVAKKRPRFVRRGKSVGTYNDQQTEEGKWIIQAGQQIKGKFDGPVKLTCWFYFPLLKSHSKAFRKRVEMGMEEPHIKKPDLDNCIKFIKDCLNELAWHDDSQVCELKATKLYSDNPRTEIRIENYMELPF